MLLDLGHLSIRWPFAFSAPPVLSVPAIGAWESRRDDSIEHFLVDSKQPPFLRLTFANSGCMGVSFQTGDDTMRPADLKLAEETRAVLAERFPDCFARKGAPTKKPLKLGMYHDLRTAAPDIKPQALQLALYDYTSGPKYLDAHTAGATRVDLNGEPAGVVTEEQADSMSRRAMGASVAHLQRRLNKVQNALRVIANYRINEKGNLTAEKLQRMARDVPGIYRPAETDAPVETQAAA